MLNKFVINRMLCNMTFPPKSSSHNNASATIVVTMSTKRGTYRADNVVATDLLLKQVVV